MHQSYNKCTLSNTQQYASILQRVHKQQHAAIIQQVHKQQHAAILQRVHTQQHAAILQRVHTQQPAHSQQGHNIVLHIHIVWWCATSNNQCHPTGETRCVIGPSCNQMLSSTESDWNSAQGIINTYISTPPLALATVSSTATSNSHITSDR